MADMKNLILGDHRDPREELDEIFTEPGVAGRSDSSATRWARDVLAKKGIDPKDQVSAIKSIREAEPRLGLKSATYLASTLTR